MRREVCEWLENKGEKFVVDPEQWISSVDGKELPRELNRLRHRLNKLGWNQTVTDLSSEDAPGNHIALLAACCKYNTKVCLVSAQPGWEEPIWLAPPSYWSDVDEDWRVHLEMSPIYIAHLHDSQFYGVETGAQHARNIVRDATLEKKRRLAAEQASQLTAGKREEEEEKLVEEDAHEHNTITSFDKAFLEVLMPPSVDKNTLSTEELQQQERLQEVLKELSEEETFNLLFEYKSMFDVFDYDSSGTMRLDEIVRAFRFYGIDLTEEADVKDGGYGKGNQAALDYLKRGLPQGQISFTEFAKKMLAERVTIAPQTELRGLIHSMEPEIDYKTKKWRVRLSKVNHVLKNFGCDVYEGDEECQDEFIWVEDLEGALKGSAPKWTMAAAEAGAAASGRGEEGATSE